MGSVFEHVEEVQWGGQSCQPLRGSKRLFKDISSLKDVMDGSVSHAVPQRLCVYACVCVVWVCALVCLQQRQHKKSCSPLPPPHVDSPLQTAGCQISAPLAKWKQYLPKVLPSTLASRV